VRNDLIRQLRRTPLYDSTGDSADELVDAIADALEASQAEVERLREALKEARAMLRACELSDPDDADYRASWDKCLAKIDAALSSPVRKDFMRQADGKQKGDTSSREGALHPGDEGMTQKQHEQLCRTIAMFHGAKMTHQVGGQMQTVASRAGFGRFGDASGEYADRHWRQYDVAANAAHDFVRDLLTADTQSPAEERIDTVSSPVQKESES